MTKIKKILLTVFILNYSGMSAASPLTCLQSWKQKILSVFKSGINENEINESEIEKSEQNVEKPELTKNNGYGEVHYGEALNRDHIAVRYFTKGNPSNQAIVYAHGLGGRGEHFLTSELGSLLAEDYFLVSFDQRGHGSTESVGHDYSSTTMAKDLHDIVTHLNLELPHVIGYSMGGRTAVRYGNLFPDQSGKIIVLDMHMKSLARSTILNKFLAFDPLLESNPDGFHAHSDFRKQLAEHDIDFGPSISFASSQNRYFVQGNLLWNYHGLKEDLTSALADLDQVLFMAGDGNVMSSVLKGVGIDHIRQTNPSAAITVVSGTGHGLLHQEPDYIHREIVEFLEN